jgi:hypothetical protein
LIKVAEDASGRDYRVAVPFDTPVKLLVSGGVLQVNDDKGAPISADGKTVTVQYTKGQPEPSPLTFTVVGRAH